MTGPEHGDLVLPLAIAAAAGYFLGALPFGYLVARSRGVNIFEVGSKSPGATNVGRVLGKWPRNLVFALDTLKGAAAAGWPLLVVWGAVRAFDVPSALGFVGLGFALVGHSFSCFTRFRGGKGVSTAVGGLLVLMQAVAAVSGLVWLCVFFATRYVSLASILAAMSLPVTAALTTRGALSLWVTGFVAAFIVVMHRTNVVRLLRGTEKRFERRRDADPKEPAGKP